MKRVGDVFLTNEEYNHYRGKLRRICEPKRHSGKLEIAEDIFEKYNAKGQSREKLFEALVKSGGDKDIG